MEIELKFNPFFYLDKLNFMQVLAKSKRFTDKEKKNLRKRILEICQEQKLNVKDYYEYEAYQKEIITIDGLFSFQDTLEGKDDPQYWVTIYGRIEESRLRD